MAKDGLIAYPNLLIFPLEQFNYSPLLCALTFHRRPSSLKKIDLNGKMGKKIRAFPIPQMSRKSFITAVLSLFLN